MTTLKMVNCRYRYLRPVSMGYLKHALCQTPNYVVTNKTCQIFTGSCAVLGPTQAKKHAFDSFGILHHVSPHWDSRPSAVRTERIGLARGDRVRKVFLTCPHGHVGFYTSPPICGWNLCFKNWKLITQQSIMQLNWQICRILCLDPGLQDLYDCADSLHELKKVRMWQLRRRPYDSER